MTAARRGRWLDVVVVVVLVLVGLGSPETASADDTDEAHDAFARGVEAIDLGRFESAIEPLRRAVRLDPTESEDRVFLSGVFSRPYLPQFYLGWALSRVDRCDEALTFLDRSDGQGVVRRFSRQFADLSAARQRCVAALLPDAEAAARRSLADAEAAARGMARPAGDPERRRLLRGVEAAVVALDSALDADDLAGVRAAGERAKRVGDEVLELSRADAETARLARLESAREPTVAPPPPTTPPPISSATITPPPPTAPPPARVSALARGLSELADSAERFLDRLPAVATDTGSEPTLTDAHRRRCRRLIARARSVGRTGTDDMLRSARERLAEALATVRFLTGVEAFLDGRPRAAVDRLGDQAEPLRDARLIARHHLLESAARFAMYRLGGELDPTQRELAAGAARSCHALAPDLAPSASLYSPAFREFFAAAVQNR